MRMYDHLRNSVTDAGLFRHLIRQTLTSPARTELRRYQRKGRLDKRAHKRIAMCRGDVFRRKTFHEGEHVAVTLLLDGSGSMSNNSKAMLANVLAIHLCEAIESAGSEVQVTGFYGTENQTCYGGLSARLVHYKKFDDRISTQIAQDRLAGFVNAVGGGTKLSAAIKFAVPNLLERPATRHILFVCCDGDCGSGVETSKAMVNYMRWKYPQVQIIGLGIMEDASYTFGEEHHVLIKNVRKLASGGLRHLLTRLQKAL